MKMNRLTITDENGFKEVVISGISGRFPESSGIEEFKENLYQNKDLVADISRRWIQGLYGLPRTGQLKDLDKFDASFFNVHAKQANVMDPQLRMLLEVTYEAIVDAGVNPNELRGTNTGVYIGASTSDSENYWTKFPDNISGYEISGCCRAMFSNRISYAFDLKGPSSTVDTACASSMFAFYRAVSDIRSGICDSAIVGGSNLILSPENTLEFVKLGLLSPDGKCKAFDSSANGYVRSESVVAIYLQRKSVARRSYAIVRHIKTNTDGFKPEGVTFPNGEMQKDLMRQVYEEAGVDPSEVSYIEAHGTGTKIGDPQELNAITEVFCKNRNASNPLLVGSVKSNMGHSEASSGLNCVAKVILAMQNGVIPANLHYNQPNEDIPGLFDGRLKVVSENMSWNGGFVGINSFGFGGCNVHVLLEQSPKLKPKEINHPLDIPSIIPFSGRTRESVEWALNKINSNQEQHALIRDICKSNISGHHFRGYTLISKGEVIKEINEGKGIPKDKLPIWFIFPGIGSQWGGMARDLIRFPVFLNSLKSSAELLKNAHGYDLMNVLTSWNETDFDNILHSCVSIITMQVALVDLLHNVGIHPDGLIGHSAGELTCAYADGCLTKEETILAAYARGKAIFDYTVPPGGMAAVGLTWEEAKTKCPSDIFPSCHNGPDNVSVSGPLESIQAFVQQLKNDGIFAKEIRSCGRAFHSKYINDVGPHLQALLDKIIKKSIPRSKRWISSSVPETKWDSPLAHTNSAEYHVNNMLSPVLFQEALVHIPENAVAIEIAPHGLMQAILKRSLPKSCVNIALMNRSASDNVPFLLKSLGKMYNSGMNPDFSKLYRKLEYPVSLGADMISPLVQWDHGVSWAVASFHSGIFQMGAKTVEVSLERESDRYLLGHNIDGRILYPATGYLVLVWKTFARILNQNYEDLPIVFEDVYFKRATILQDGHTTKFTISFMENKGEFEIVESSIVVCKGRIRIPNDSNKEFIYTSSFTEAVVERESKYIPLDSSEVYRELRLRGYNYNGVFVGIAKCNNEGDSAMLSWNDNWVSFLDTMLQFSLISSGNKGSLRLPTRLQKVTCDPRIFKQLIVNNASCLAEGIAVKRLSNVDVIKCPGIEFRGLVSTQSSRRQSRYSKAKLLAYRFTNYIEDFPDMKMDSDELIIENFIDITMENSPSRKLIVSEVSPDCQKSCIPKIQCTIASRPMWKADLTLLTLRTENAMQTVQEMENNGINVVLREELDYPVVYDGQDLIIISDLRLVEMGTVFLKNGGFLLIRLDDLNNIPDSAQLTLVAKKSTKTSSFFLFRKVTKNTQTCNDVIHIPLSNSNFDWVEDLQHHVKLASKSENYPRIYLTVCGDPTSGVIGLIKCLKQEIGGNKIRSIFHPEGSTIPMDFKTPDLLLQEIIRKDLFQNVIYNGKLGSFCHVPINDEISQVQSVTHAYINTLVRGDLSTINWIESPENSSQQETLENCTVCYAPLNFRDIMLATGKLSPDALPGNIGKEDCVLGLEFSGITSQGTRLMGMVPAKGLSTVVNIDPTFSWKVPGKWSLKEASTIPVVYSTAYYALIVRGKLKEKESVLIHSGSGGVGQAAISIALSMNCRVFTTVSSTEKRELLMSIFPQLKHENFSNSRDCTFEQHILQHTNGQGVDVVLNSLSEEKLISSVRCLAQHGRFLEIGKFDLSENNPLGMSVFLKNVTFHGILLDALFEKDSTDKREVVQLVSEGISSGVVKPLPFTLYSHNEVESAFRFMASGKHTGKVIIEIRDENWINMEGAQTVMAHPRTYFDPKKVYIILGGLGGFGLELTDWMISRRAKKFLLVSRSGVTRGYQDLCLRRWRENGAQISISKTSVKCFNSAVQIVGEGSELGQLGGIFNLAVVLKDGFIENQTQENFVSVCQPKINTTFFLDSVTRMMCPKLEHFVAFSSIASGFGNAGQANYGMANSSMERICEFRRRDGYSGLAIQWGVIGDVGILEGLKQDDVIGGTIAQNIRSCFSFLDLALKHANKYPTVTSFVLADEIKTKSGLDNISSVASTVGHIMGIKNTSSVSQSATLGELGMDSLMVVELKQKLEKDYDLILSNEELVNLSFSSLQELQNSMKK